MRIGFIIFLIFLLKFSSAAQSLPSGLELGGRAGIVYSWGMPVNRIGIMAGGFVLNNHAQVNGEIRYHFNYSSFGPQRSSKEWIFSLGATGAFGPDIPTEKGFIFPFFNQTKKKYSLSYSVQFYRDNMVTSQSSGTIGFQVGKFYFYTENDLFANKIGVDKFRTGGFFIGYRHRDWLWTIHSAFWHGDSMDMEARFVMDSEYPARWGYKDLSKAVYGNYSHGILGVQVYKMLPFQQVLTIGAGVDAEQVRNVIQNRIIHDMYFIPEKWTTVRNVHFPMLDSEGKPFLYDPDQKIRPPRPYFQFSVNGNYFY